MSLRPWLITTPTMHSIDGNRNGCFSTDDVPVQLQLDELAGRSGPVGEHAYNNVP